MDESLFQEIEDLDLDEDDPDFGPLEMGSDEDWDRSNTAEDWQNHTRSPLDYDHLKRHVIKLQQLRFFFLLFFF